MKRSRQVAILVVFAVIGVIAACIGLLAARPESKTESRPYTKVEDNFKVSCSSISYGEMASPHKRLSLSCQVEILDPNCVLAISEAPVIEEVTDEKGHNLEIDSELPCSGGIRYGPATTSSRFVAGPKQSKWKTGVRSALRLPPKKRSRSHMVREVQPSPMQIDLSFRPGEQSGQEIHRVKGHFYALVADSFEYVAVPFETSDKWVRLTPDLEIQVSEASCDGSRYRLVTKTRPEEGGYLGWLSSSTSLPGRLALDEGLIGRDNKPVGSWGGRLRLPFHVGGSSGGSGGTIRQIAKIRYVIAVNPTHYKIPFVLENIPLPKP